MTREITPQSPRFFSTLSSNPTALLLIVGALIGLNFPLGKIAGSAGISPIVWAMTVSSGACVLLLPILLYQGGLPLPRGKVVRYVIISGAISFVVPNLILFSVIPNAGAGYTGLMFALSPVFTLALSMVFGMKPPNLLGSMGVALGFCGATVVAVTRGAEPAAPEPRWILLALMIPVSLAVGNIYRTLDWPKESAPDTLAFWCHAFAIAVYAALSLAVTGHIPIAELSRAPAAALLQAISAGLTFPCFFRLQRQGGPVLLSQIGYVAAAVGLCAATVVMGERYSVATWAGAGVIGIGIAATILAQRSR